MPWTEGGPRALAVLTYAALSLALLGARSMPAQPQGAPGQPRAGQSAPPALPRMESPQSAPPLPAPPAPRVQPHFVVVVDAAHGGSETGARLSDRLLEKDLVLGLAVRLRSMLNARGIPVVTTRESDATLPALNRAEVANQAFAAACLSLHATSSGSGIHLFTASLTPAPLTRFLPWETAQGAYAEQSLRLSSEINSAMAHAEVPVTLGRTALEPLDSFACPAVAVEVAPLEGAASITQLTDPGYQTRLVSAITAAIVQWQRDWRLQP